jgi:hypothetical protein
MARAASASLWRASNAAPNVVSSARSRSLREAGLSRIHFGEPLHDDGQIGAHDGFIEPQHDVAGTHPAAVTHQHLADDPTGQVLHLLHVGIDDDRPGRNHRARELGGCGPAAETDG